MDVQHLSGCTRRFEIFAAVVPQTEVQTLPDRGPLDHVDMAFELVADCGSNEVGPVRVEAFLHHQVDVAEVDIAEVDRDLLGVARPWSQFMYVSGHPLYHPYTICMDGIWMLTAILVKLFATPSAVPLPAVRRRSSPPASAR